MIVSAYGFALLCLRLPLGILSDRIGRRKPFVTIGLVLASLAGVGLALAPSPQAMVLMRLLSGVSACAWVAFAVLFAGYYPPGQTTRAMGHITFCNGFSIMAASFLGGWLADTFGWVAPFWASACFGLLGCATSLLMHEAPNRSQRTPGLAQIQIVLQRPVLIWSSIVSALGMYTIFASGFGFLPTYAVSIGATKTQLGLLSTISLFFSSFAGLVSGTWTIPRFGIRRSIVASNLVVGATIALVPLIHTVPLLYLMQTINGIARGTAYPALMTMVIADLPDREKATAMGFYQSVYSLGMFLGPVGAGQIGESLGYGGLFASTAGVALLAAVAAFKLPAR